jgi:hypothetical protein
VGSSPVLDVPLIKGTVETTRLDWSACCTSWSSPLIWLNISSCFSSCFFASYSETSFSAAIKKSKSSGVRVVLSMVWVALAFFRKEGFGGVIFLFMEGSSSSIGGVTLPLFFSTSVPPSSSPSPPYTSEIEVVFMDVLGIYSTSSSFLVFLA